MQGVVNADTISLGEEDFGKSPHSLAPFSEWVFRASPQWVASDDDDTLRSPKYVADTVSLE
jgi:hypothetical protein